MGHEEHGGTWHMDAAQLDTQRKKGEAILKTSSTVYSTNRSSSSTRPAKLQLDRAENTSEPAQILELKNMVSQLLTGRQGVHAIDDALATNEDTLMEFMGDATEENQEEVNCIRVNYGNRGFNQPFRAHPNLSYRSNNVENPNDQVYPNLSNKKSTPEGCTK
ncbi:unnamed protein product [Microthlaspi erraticum]|uniref:Uncharacterized protein n=1 Tax=Microthlaspi erraticum TaxID=1685480 RepID=A0A6D2K2P4_9BRAS|nr:unnamed protein product [Microthlaspi erraticum]